MLNLHVLNKLELTNSCVAVHLPFAPDILKACAPLPDRDAGVEMKELGKSEAACPSPMGARAMSWSRLVHLPSAQAPCALCPVPVPGGAGSREEPRGAHSRGCAQVRGVVVPRVPGGRITHAPKCVELMFFASSSGASQFAAHKGGESDYYFAL